jgi:solute carrier family 12 sodium/potassium/chloride transporter 2
LAVDQFKKRSKKPLTIDVWWLYDDGGLAMLIPHILSIAGSYLEGTYRTCTCCVSNTMFAGAKLRVFTMSEPSETVEKEREDVKKLLFKLRIAYDELQVLKDVNEKPKVET